MTESYQITDRSLSRTESQFHYDFTSEIKALPANPIVLISGSGTRGQFEGDIKKIRPDIKTVSIDPSLYLSANMEIVDLADKTVLIYQNKDSPITQSRPLGPQEAKDLQTNRIKNHQSDLPIAAEALKLPLASNSLDAFIDIMGPFHYLRNDIQRLSEYLSEMVSVIRSGGVAYLVDCGKDEYSLLKQMGGIKIVNATEIERNGGEYFTVKLQKL